MTCYKIIQSEIARNFLRENYVDIDLLPIVINIRDENNFKLLNADFLHDQLPVSSKHATSLLTINPESLPTWDYYCIEPVDNQYKIILKTKNKVSVHCDRLNNANSWTTPIDIIFTPNPTVEVRTRTVPAYRHRKIPVLDNNEYPRWAIVNNFRVTKILNSSIEISYNVVSVVDVNIKSLW